MQWRDLAKKAIYKSEVKRWDNRKEAMKGNPMWRVFKVLVFLTALAALGLIAYAYVGPWFFAEDFAPPVEQVTEPVTLDLE